MVVYDCLGTLCNKSYVGKTQVYAKTRISMQHIIDVWKVIESGRMKYGENWFGSGGYKKADAFAKHFA